MMIPLIVFEKGNDSSSMRLALVMYMETSEMVALCSQLIWSETVSNKSHLVRK